MVPVLLVGPPGCGKTGRIQQIAKECGFNLMATGKDGRVHSTVWRMVRKERPDLQGAMIPDLAAGMTRELPLESLHALRNTKEKTMLFLDDFGQAPEDTQASAMGLFDDGELPPNVLIWGATNGVGQGCGVKKLLEPLRSRFRETYEIAGPGTTDDPAGGVLLQPWAELDSYGSVCGGEVGDWIEWAFDQEADPVIIAWMRSTAGRGQEISNGIRCGGLYEWKQNANMAVRCPDYRAWHQIIRQRKNGIRSMQRTSAVIGKAAASVFCAFEQLADKIPTPDQVRMDPKGAPVPTDPSPLYLVSTMLSCAATAKDAEPFTIYLGRLPRVFGALLARDMYRKLGAKLSGSKAWAKWFTENQALFQV